MVRSPEILMLCIVLTMLCCELRNLFGGITSFSKQKFGPLCRKHLS